MWNVSLGLYNMWWFLHIFLLFRWINIQFYLHIFSSVSVFGLFFRFYSRFSLNEGKCVQTTRAFSHSFSINEDENDDKKVREMRRPIARLKSERWENSKSKFKILLLIWTFRFCVSIHWNRYLTNADPFRFSSLLSCEFDRWIGGVFVETCKHKQANKKKRRKKNWSYDERTTRECQFEATLPFEHSSQHLVISFLIHQCSHRQQIFNRLTK